MIIQHNIASLGALRSFGTNESNTRGNLEKLSSGYKINRAGDDAAGLAISETMRAQINGLEQASDNAKDAISLIKTAEGALTETHSILQRMTTLATQSANGTYTETGRKNIQDEVNELANEIDRIANNTDYNGINPLAKKMTAPGDPAANPPVAPTYGPAPTLTFQIGPTAAEVLTVQGQDMTFDGILTAGGSALGTAPNRLDVDTVANANKSITAIKKGIETVSAFRSKLGAAQNRLEHTVNHMDTTNEYITEAESRIRDTDMAEEMTKYTKNNILMQAAQSMLAQANQQPNNILSMLR